MPESVVMGDKMSTDDWSIQFPNCRGSVRVLRMRNWGLLDKKILDRNHMLKTLVGDCTIRLILVRFSSEWELFPTVWV